MKHLYHVYHMYYFYHRNISPTYFVRYHWHSRDNYITEEMLVHLKLEKWPTPSLPGRPFACRPSVLGALHHGLHHVPLLPHLHCSLQGRHANLCHPLQSVIFPENSQISKKCMQQPLRSFSKAHIIAFQSATKLKIEPNRLVS